MLVASNIKCFRHGQGHQTHLKMIVTVVMTLEMILDPSSESDNEVSEDVIHTVPFKVLGSPYSVERVRNTWKMPINFCMKEKEM